MTICVEYVDTRWPWNSRLQLVWPGFYKARSKEGATFGSERTEQHFNGRTEQHCASKKGKTRNLNMCQVNEILNESQNKTLPESSQKKHIPLGVPFRNSFWRFLRESINFSSILCQFSNLPRFHRIDVLDNIVFTNQRSWINVLTLISLLSL